MTDLRIATLDFETYFDEKYTLKKLSTSEYIRSNQFEMLSCSVRLPDRPTACYFGLAEIASALADIDWKTTALLAHHAHFEGLILSEHLNIVPALYLDTLSMSRASYSHSLKHGLKDLAARLGVPTQKLEMPDFKGRHLAEITPEERAKIALYNNGDVDACFEAFQALRPRFPDGEIELIDTTVRMFAVPVLKLDEPRTMAELKREIAAKEAKVAASGMSAEDLSSGAKFCDALRSLGVEPPMKYSAKQKKEIPALAQTDEAFLALAKHPENAVRELVEARLAVKSTIGETRARRLLNAGKDGRRLPVYLNYCGAHTTRWSGGDKLNFQNFPRGGELRRSLMAPPGHVLVVTDSSQIEARTLAWLAGEAWMLEEFARPDGDPYARFASEVYGRKITKKTDPDERQVGKVCVLALGYGMGAWKLRNSLLSGQQGPAIELPMEMCETLVSAYRGLSRAVTLLWHRGSWVIDDMAVSKPGVRHKRSEFKAVEWEHQRLWLPNGLALHYDGVQSHCSVDRSKSGAAQKTPMGMLTAATHEWGSRRVSFYDQMYRTIEGWSHLYGGLLVENVVQALARIIVADQMRVIARRYRVVLMSHDEVVTAVPKSEADEALAWQLSVMKTRPAWAPDLPLNAEGGYDTIYSK